MDAVITMRAEQYIAFSLCTPVYYEFDPAGYGTLLSSDV